MVYGGFLTSDCANGFYLTSSVYTVGFCLLFVQLGYVYRSHCIQLSSVFHLYSWVMSDDHIVYSWVLSSVCTVGFCLTLLFYPGAFCLLFVQFVFVFCSHYLDARSFSSLYISLRSAYLLLYACGQSLSGTVDLCRVLLMI